MSEHDELLPPPPRSFPGQRWADIGLRCAHLVGVAGIGGGFLFALPDAQWLPLRYLTLASGGLLALLYVWSDPAWLIQLKGQAVLLKLALLAFAHFHPASRAGIFIVVIVLSGVFAHAPSRVRGYAWGRAVRGCGRAAQGEQTK
ncbi:MAG: hypothetical protein KBA72_05925 [Thermoanaerobaculia bacterium]|nr:hypothetical protein [Thermoanaerobaculia bacterium]